MSGVCRLLLVAVAVAVAVCVTEVRVPVAGGSWETEGVGALEVSWWMGTEA